MYSQCTDEFLPVWLELVERSDFINPFFHPHVLIPALKLYGTNVKLYHHKTDASEIFFPLKSGVYSRSWIYPHCYLGTPLIVGEFTNLDEFNSILINVNCSDVRFKGSVRSLDESYTRPIILNQFKTLDDYLRDFCNSARRKDYRKKMDPFYEEGEFLTYIFDSINHPNEDLVNEFLTLEDIGWKGRNRTSILASDKDTEFFRSVFGYQDSSMLGSLKIMFNSLRYKDVTVAMRTSLVLRGEILSFKIAYNEDFRSYSPGLVLELFLIAYFLESKFKMLDSCSGNNRPFTDIYRDKRQLFNTTYANGKVSSETFARSIRTLRRVYRGWKNWLE